MDVTGMGSSVSMHKSANEIQADAAMKLIEGGTRAASAVMASDGQLRTDAMHAQGVGQRLDIVV